MEYLEILVKLRKIIRSINLESKRTEKEFGISIPQLLVLQFLSEQPSYTATSTQIKEYVNLNASTVSGIISRLEAKTLIARVVRGEDRRSVGITLTALGAELLRKSPTPLQEKLANRLQSLKPTQIQELNTNIELLTTLLEVEPPEASRASTGKSRQDSPN